MQKIAILKTGSTLPELARQKGDFEDWIISGMGGEHAGYETIKSSDGDPLPDYAQISGVVITGSHAMVTDHLEWSERIARWLPGAVEQEIPVLGICYGHQLLAYALGGEVGYLPHTWEYGTVDVSLEPAASNDLLLGSLPNPARLQVGHAQTVTRLPAGSQLLASSELDEHQAFIVGRRAWGVQFHPEFDADVSRAYIAEVKETLIAQGKNPKQLLAQCQNTPWGETILHNFNLVCQEFYNEHRR